MKHTVFRAMVTLLGYIMISRIQELCALCLLCSPQKGALSPRRCCLDILSFLYTKHQQQIVQCALCLTWFFLVLIFPPKKQVGFATKAVLESMLSFWLYNSSCTLRVVYPFSSYKTSGLFPRRSLCLDTVLSLSYTNHPHMAHSVPHLWLVATKPRLVA